MTDGRTDAADGRAQTNVDFVVGVGVFLLTVGVVTSYATGMVTPFAGDHSGPMVADRVADDLTRTALAGATTGTLHPACTATFFGAATATCPFDPTASLHDRVGVADHYGLNVTVERTVTGSADPEILCTDASGSVGACSSGGTRLAVGRTPPTGSDSLATATRIAHLDGRDVRVVVRVW